MNFTTTPSGIIFPSLNFPGSEEFTAGAKQTESGYISNNSIMLSVLSAQTIQASKEYIRTNGPVFNISIFYLDEMSNRHDLNVPDSLSLGHLLLINSFAGVTNLIYSLSSHANGDQFV